MEYRQMCKRLAVRSEMKLENGKELSVAHVSHVLSIIISEAAGDKDFFSSLIERIADRSRG